MRLAIVSAVMAASSCAFAANMLTMNPSFESGGDENFPNWTVVNNANVNQWDYGISGGLSPIPDGTSFGYLRSKVTIETAADDRADVVAGEEYVLSAWAEYDTIGSATLSLVWYDAASAEVSVSSLALTNIPAHVAGVSFGQQYFLTATAPAGATSAAARFAPGLDPDGYVRVDAFSLTPVPEPTSIALLGLGSLVMLRRRRPA